MAPELPAEIARQGVVNGGSRYGGMPFCDTELVKIGNDVSSGIEPFDRSFLVPVHLKESGAGAPGAQRAREPRVDLAAQCGIQHVEFKTLSAVQCHAHAAFCFPKALRRGGRDRYVRLRHLPGEQFIGGSVAREDRQALRIGPQEKRFVCGFPDSTIHGDILAQAS